MPGEATRFLTRRAVLRGIGASSAVGILSPLLAACGSSSSTPAATTSSSSSGTTGGATAAATAKPAAGGSSPAASGTPGAQTASPGAGTGAVSQPTAPSGKKGGDIALAQSSDATTLDPAKTTATVDYQIFLSVFNHLITLDEKGNLAPELATSWEEAGDHLSWTLKLRQGIKFHDGTDFNAAAVKTNIERYIDPALNSPRKGEIPSVTGVDVVDDYTAKINLNAAFVTLPYALTGTSGIIVSPAAIQKYGDDLARNPVGTGPFIFKEWIKNDHVLVNTNPNYWLQGRPLLNSVSYKGIGDASAVLNGMRSGALQVTYGLAASDISQVKSDPTFNLILQPSTSVTALRFNLTQPPLDKKEIRQAIAWAIDRDSIEKALYFGTGVPANTFLGPLNLGYNKDITLYKQVDTNKAKQLLQAGGQPNGFKFTAQTISNTDGLKLAQAVKSQLETINVDMELEVLDGVTILQKLVDKQFQASFVTYNGGVEPFQGLSRFFLSTSTLNVYGYNSSQFDSLLNQASATTDTNARAALYSQLTALLSEDCPWAFLRYPAQTELFRKELKGYVYNPDGGIRLDTVSLS